MGLIIISSFFKVAGSTLAKRAKNVTTVQKGSNADGIAWPRDII
jgi:hypothetical protein